jgi:energy-converting hydrogenase Eha subunit C
MAESLLPIRWRPKLLSRSIVGAELVVGRALLGILERLIGLGNLLEFLLGAGLLRDVGMIFARETSIGLLDVRVAGAAFQTQATVIVLVLHTCWRE